MELSDKNWECKCVENYTHPKKQVRCARCLEFSDEVSQARGGLSERDETLLWASLTTVTSSDILINFDNAAAWSIRGASNR